jgi:hypothetical protein
MIKLENKIQRKIERQGRISYLSPEETSRIQLGTRERMKKYNQKYIKKQHASYIAARKVIFNA